MQPESVSISVSEPAPDAQRSEPRLLERTGGRLARALRDMRGAARVRLTGSVRADLPDDDLARLRQRIDECLEMRGGEVSARAQAADIGRSYLELNDVGRERFLCMLSNDYGVDHGAVRAVAQSLHGIADGAALAKAERELRGLLEAPRMRLLKQFNGISEGVKFLVDLRADLLALARQEPRLMPLAHELRELLASWFDAGFLELRAIDWDAPAALLEKLIAYEAVHEIRSWDDLKNRLESDRRCYAFFHPAMPDEPLIFVEVALVSGMADNVQDLLDATAPQANPDDADTAIFYSISNAQAGLAGVGFGEFLIKRVVDDLRGRFPKLKRFATLSPIPGFAAWLSDMLASGDSAILLPAGEALEVVSASGEAEPNAALKQLLDDPCWPDDPAKLAALQPALLRLGARYLLNVRKPGGRARDPVAHFHLTNGARVERLNFLGDRSQKGMAQSHGLMVNYLYKLGEIEKNHERYKRGRGRIPGANAVRDLC